MGHCKTTGDCKEVIVRMGFEIFTEENRQQERELLAAYDLDAELFGKLNFGIKQIVPERGCFRIETDKGFFCLKKMSFPFQDIFLMHEMAAHLRKNGFENVSQIVRQADGGILLPYQGSEYYLTQWMDGRESDYLNPADIKAATEALAKLHIAAEGFSTKLNISGRRLFGRWKKGFLQKQRGIADAKKYIESDCKGNENTQIVSDYLKMCEEDARRTMMLLEEADFDKLNARDEGKHGFIHHDYGFYNITHGFMGETFIGGLERAAFDIRMHDLGYFIFKLMRRRGWDNAAAMDIISCYDGIIKLDKTDYQALAVYLTMPHDFNQYQRSYYSTDRETEDLEEVERLNIHSDYNRARRQLLRNIEKSAGLI